MKTQAIEAIDYLLEELSLIESQWSKATPKAKTSLQKEHRATQRKIWRLRKTVGY